MNKQHFLFGIFLLFPILNFVNAAEQDFTEIGFDELMQMEITSVSKKNEKLSEAAAAVYVVTADEIRRTGATSIPEALRLVPGVDVAQIDPNKWSVSIRGFTGLFANKLLVLIDGRSVYTPAFSGVYWEYFDYLMSDIERIEVIRGPGATLWGSNAVNGVINIITRSAGENPGGSISVDVGNEYQGVGMRQGGSLSENAQLRAYAKAKHLDDSNNIDGDSQDNGGDYLQTGLRLDGQLNDSQSVTLKGDLYRTDSGEQQNLPVLESSYTNQIITSDVKEKGGNIDVSWNKLTGVNSELNIASSYTFYDYDGIKYGNDNYAFSLELQHQFSPFTDHDIVWGAGYKLNYNDFTSKQYLDMESVSSNSKIWNVFVQDSILFPAQNIAVTLGAKLEHNDYSGSDFQPNLRISWVPHDDLTLWGAISRANRSPSLGEVGGIVTLGVDDQSGVQVLTQVLGNKDFKSEQLDAYELGIRWMPYTNLSFDLATFYNDYDDLRSSIIGEIDSSHFDYTDYSGYLIQALELENNMEGYSVGGELLATWQATLHSRYRFVYNYLHIDIADTAYNEASSALISLIEDRALEHQLSVWGSFDLSDTVELDLRLYYNAPRSWSSFQYEDEKISGYFQGDMRIGWQATPSLSLALVGRNLLHNEQQEFISESWGAASAIERSVFLNGTLKW